MPSPGCLQLFLIPPRQARCQTRRHQCFNTRVCRTWRWGPTIILREAHWRTALDLGERSPLINVPLFARLLAWLSRLEVVELFVVQPVRLCERKLLFAKYVLSPLGGFA